MILRLDNGEEERISLAAYRDAVFRVTDSIERFYRDSVPKQLEDAYEQAGYTAFWHEWHR